LFPVCVEWGEIKNQKLPKTFSIVFDTKNLTLTLMENYQKSCFWLFSVFSATVYNVTFMKTAMSMAEITILYRNLIPIHGLLLGQLSSKPCPQKENSFVFLIFFTIDCKMTGVPWAFFHCKFCCIVLYCSQL